jgi:hypothetical protein
MQVEDDYLVLRSHRSENTVCTVEESKTTRWTREGCGCTAKRDAVRWLHERKAP